MKMRDLCANKREIKYKKEERLKISHFWSPKETHTVGREEEEEEEKRRRRAKKLWNSKVLYGFP